MVTMEIPWPPSLNRYYRHVGSKVLISRLGQKYRELLSGRVKQMHIKPYVTPVAVYMQFYPPDRRRRDLDNLLKCTLDAFTHGGLWTDDSLARYLQLEMLEPMPPDGIVIVRITNYEKK